MTTIATQPASPTTRTEPQVPVQLKLAAAWTSFMFMYVYVDLLGFYKPGTVEGILDGKVHTFDISQTFMTSALAATVIPVAMIGLSMNRPGSLSRELGQPVLHPAARLAARARHRRACSRTSDQCLEVVGPRRTLRGTLRQSLRRSAGRPTDHR